MDGFIYIHCNCVIFGVNEPDNMNDFLHSIVLDNPILSYLIGFGTILLALIFKRYLSKHLAGFLFSLLKRTSWNVDKKQFTELLLAPLQGFLIILISFVALDKL